MEFDSVIFDLDGTLWDTCGSCAIAWNNVIRRNAIDFREITASDIASVTGLSHEECIRSIFKELPEDTILKISEETTKEDNLMIQKHGGILYPQVQEGIRQLSTSFSLFIVSNCQSGYIELFLEKFKFHSYFKDIECWGNTRNSKGMNIQSIINRNNLSKPVYIGDTTGDRDGANYCSIPFIQVTYGFGAPIEDVPKVDSFPELLNIFYT